MTIIKRCEKEVPGTWADKQQQAKSWLGHFVSHYSRRCLPASEAEDRCPASHSTTNDASKKWLDIENPQDRAKMVALEQLIDRMKADVTMYIHGYNTCAVECAHGERTVHTNKRIEYWSSWEGRCRLVQLLHNHHTRVTGESLLQQLGWQVAGGVSTHLIKIDRDKAKHRQRKTAPSYNARQKALLLEKKERAATDIELITRAAAQKQKARVKQRHKYYAKKQLLYEAEEMKRGGVGEERKEVAAVPELVKRKGGRPKKREAVEKEEAPKENTGGMRSPSPAGGETAKRTKTDTTKSVISSERPALKALVRNSVVGVRLVMHPAMQMLESGELLMTG